MAIVGKRYEAVRKKLDDLGFRQQMSFESLCLVEKLVKEIDKLSTKVERIHDPRLEAKQDAAPSSLEVLKAENTQLIQENNRLNHTIMNQLESSELSVNELRTRNRKLQNEVDDYKFLNSQYVNKVRQLEQENGEMADKILSLQEKHSVAIIQTRNHGSAFHRQRMEIESPLPPAELSDVGKCRMCGSPLDDPVEDNYVPNMLEVADKRIAQLQQEISGSKSQIDDLRQSNERLRQQLQARDSEIDRLNKQIMTTKHVTFINSSDTKNETDYSKYIHKIDCIEASKDQLKKELQTVMKELNDAECKVTELTIRNRELENKLTVNYEGDRPCDNRHPKHDTECQTKSNLSYELHKLKEVLYSRDKEIHELKNNNFRLNDKINKLLANEKVMRKEVCDLHSWLRSPSKDRTNGHVSRRGKCTERELKLVEMQRNYYMQKTEELSQQVRQARRLSCPPRTDSHCHHCPDKQRSSLSASLPGLNRLPPKTPTKRRAVTPPPRWHSPTCKVHTFPSPTSSLSKSRSPSPKAKRKLPLPTSPTIHKCSQGVDGSECASSRRGFEETRQQVCQYEAEIKKLQKSLRVATDDKERMTRLYHEAENDLKKLQERRSVGTSLAEKSNLKRIEREKEALNHELNATIIERDALKDRLNAVVEAQITERKRFEKQIENVELSLEEREKELSKSNAYMNSYKSLSNQSEDQIRTLERELSEANDRMSQYKSSANHMKKLLEQTQQQLDTCERELAMKDTTGLEECLKKLEQELEHSNRKNMKQLNEMENLRRTMASMDRDKDKLQTEVDVRIERVASFEDALRHKEKIINDLKLTIHTLETNLDQLREELIARDNDYKTLKRQLELTERELDSFNTAHDGYEQRLRDMNDDLATMTRENQRLNHELKRATDEQQELKRQVQEYVNEVARVEEILNEKEQERIRLLEQFHNVTHEANSLENQNNQLETETATARLELHAKNIEIQHLQTSLNNLQQEVEEHIATHQRLELELNQANRNLAVAEEDKQKYRQQAIDLQDDLNTVRALCTQLDSTKEQICKQLADKEVECEQYKDELQEAENQAKGLQGEVQQQRIKMRELENLLSNNRHVEFQSQLSIQDMASELRLARDQLADSENRLLLNLEEATSLRSKAANMETEIESLKRQLTNERFEKEKARQDLKRFQKKTMYSPPPPTERRVLLTDESRSPQVSPRAYTASSYQQRDLDFSRYRHTDRHALGSSRLHAGGTSKENEFVPSETNRNPSKWDQDYYNTADRNQVNTTKWQRPSSSSWEGNLNKRYTTKESLSLRHGQTEILSLPRVSNTLSERYTPWEKTPRSVRFVDGSTEHSGLSEFRSDLAERTRLLSSTSPRQRSLHSPPSGV